MPKTQSQFAPPPPYLINPYLQSALLVPGLTADPSTVLPTSVASLDGKPIAAQDSSNLAEGLEIGDVVEMIDPQQYFMESSNPPIPVEKLIHGQLTFGAKFQEEKATIVGKYKEYFLVKWTNLDDKKMQLGYKKENLRLIRAVPRIKLDLNELFNEVILPASIKDEILALIKQHENSSLIFDTWGLGETVLYGRGMTMLFHGEPGTGKTYTAQLIAKYLKKELRTIDTSILGSPFQGEFERALKKEMDEAKENGDVVFLDECDSLIQSREGMGQIMSGENNMMLRVIEQYEGVLIMATNRIGSLDSALERRLALIIEFPKPKKAERLKIWKKIIPKKMPVEKVDFEELSTYELTGGQIKNCVLAAARYAVLKDDKKVEQKDFQKAILKLLEGSKAFTENRERIAMQGYKRRG